MERKLFNSKSPVLAQQTFSSVEKIVGFDYRVSGVLEAFRTMDNMLNTRIIKNYAFNLALEDFKVFNINSIKAIANGSNQSLIGQTVNRTAYDVYEGSIRGEYYAGVFNTNVDTIASNEMQVIEKELGKTAINQLWIEYDQHILGNISPKIGEGKKLNQGLLDYITNIDNSIFGTSTITPSSMVIQEVYSKLCNYQTQLNSTNGGENFSPVVVIVSGTNLQSLFLQPINIDHGGGLTLEILLNKRKIYPIYLSNKTDTRDYCIMLGNNSIELYNGNEPLRTEKEVDENKSWRKIYQVYYVMNNPIIIPTALGDIGYILNGGANGINGGAVFSEPITIEEDGNF
jgi:hypothetical protein